MLAWIAERCEGTAERRRDARSASSPPPGALPRRGARPRRRTTSQALLAVDVEGWEAELPRMAEHLATFGDRLPPELRAQLDDLRDDGWPRRAELLQATPERATII